MPYTYQMASEITPLKLKDIRVHIVPELSAYVAEITYQKLFIDRYELHLGEWNFDGDTDDVIRQAVLSAWEAYLSDIIMEE